MDVGLGSFDSWPLTLSTGPTVTIGKVRGSDSRKREAARLVRQMEFHDSFVLMMQWASN